LDWLSLQQRENQAANEGKADQHTNIKSAGNDKEERLAGKLERDEM
jgi:hypothetical protein